VTVDAARRTVRLDPDALAVLEEQRGFLQRSLADLEREHAAGDLDDTDHATLEADYERRLASVSAAIEEGRATFSAARRTQPKRTILVVVAVIVFALACGVGVAKVAGRRVAGDSVSGDVPLTSRERLAQCLADFAEKGNFAASAGCYDDVARADPTNVEAKTYGPGVRVMTGDPSTDPDYVQRVVDLTEIATANPSYPDVHAFLAVGFYKLGRADSARAELRKLDSLNPSPAITGILSGFRSQIEKP
jgi:cytochrome c-type biogenesis protein CcmI